MSNRIVYSDIFRLSYPHLEKPQEPQKAGDKAKYGFSMMFPQSGILPVNNQPSTWDNIFAALNEVCMEQWNISFEQATAAGMGIEYPPKKKNGNEVFEKDVQGNPIPNKVHPNTANMWILSVKNEDPIGCCDPSGGVDIAPKELLAGYWAAAELECSAYDSKNGRVLVVKALNVQLCYKDETFGNKRVSTPASAAFANRAVADTNIAQGSIPRAAVQAPIAPSVPSTPQQVIAPPPTPAVPETVTNAIAPPPVINNNPVIMNAGEPTYAAMVAAGWTAETLIANNKAKANVLNPSA
jgi:hypothetical protein